MSRGGYRKGSGRKPSGRKPYLIRMKPATHQALKLAAGTKGIGAYLDDVMK